MRLASSLLLGEVYSDVVLDVLELSLCDIEDIEDVEDREGVEDQERDEPAFVRVLCGDPERIAFPREHPKGDDERSKRTVLHEYIHMDMIPEASRIKQIICFRMLSCTI